MRSAHKILLSCIIVTWNSEEDIETCLRSVYESTKNIPTEIFVVDNVSTDRTVSIVSKKFPRVILLPQKKNWGFGQGNNIALKQANGTYILLLNPDTKVNTHAIRTMIRFINTHPKTGAVGPEQFNADGDTVHMLSRHTPAGNLEFIAEKLYRLFLGKSIILFPWPHRTYILNGGCILAKSELLPTRTWFDPDCFIYGEEHYLFGQIKRMGWDVYFLRNCSIIHYREKSIAQTGKKFKFLWDTTKVMAKKSTIGKILSKLFSL